MAPILGARAPFLCVRWAPSLSPGESVCVVVTMNYGSPWERGLQIMLMKVQPSLKPVLTDPPNHHCSSWPWWIKLKKKKCLKFH